MRYNVIGSRFIVKRAAGGMHFYRETLRLPMTTHNQSATWNVNLIMIDQWSCRNVRFHNPARVYRWSTDTSVIHWILISASTSKFSLKTYQIYMKCLHVHVDFSWLSDPASANKQNEKNRQRQEYKIRKLLHSNLTALTNLSLAP